MALSTSVSTPYPSFDVRDTAQNANTEIQNLLLEVLPNASPDIQLEIHGLIKQVRALNELLGRTSTHSGFRNLFYKPNALKLLLILDEIKNPLLLIKTNKISLEFLRDFRIDLQKEINASRYSLWQFPLNTLLAIGNIKSAPIKLLCGLLITSSLATVSLMSIAQKIYVVEQSYHAYFRANPSQLQTGAALNQDPPASPPKSNSDILLDNSLVKLDYMFYKNQHIWYALIYAAIAGLLGSVTSILLRIIDFRDNPYSDPWTPFFVGLFKPIIGLLFGIFFCALIMSNTVIKIDFLIDQNQESSALITNKARQDLFIFTCAFIIGFSERFASDLLKKTESKFTDS